MNVRLNSGRSLEVELAWQRTADGELHKVRWCIGAAVSERWRATYSADRLAGGSEKPRPLKGAVEIAGRRYVCMGSVGSGAAGDMELEMVELLDPAEFPHASPCPPLERFHNRGWLRGYGRNYYGAGPVKVSRRPGEWILGWDWTALVARNIAAEAIIELHQVDLFAPPRPWPCDRDAD